MKHALIIMLALAVLLVAGCGSSKSRTHLARHRPTAAQRVQQLREQNYGEDAIRATLKAEGYTHIPPRDVSDADDFACKSNETKFGLCPRNPYYGMTIAKARAARIAKARAEARAEARRKAARRAYLQRINAWHQGYFRVATDTSYGETDPGAYAKWVHGISCEAYVGEYGCWHVEVVVRDGCPSYVAVEANEYQGDAVVNDLLDNNATGLPPKTPVLFELDASEAGTTANDLKVDCS